MKKEGKKKHIWKCPIGHPTKGTMGWKKKTVDEPTPEEWEQIKRKQLRKDEEYE